MTVRVGKRRFHRQAIWRVTVRLAAAGVWLTLTFAPPLTHAAGAPLTGRTIVIDPGHGGIDSGALGNGLEEKNLTLPISLDTGALLSQAGARVIYTRTTDTTVGPADNTTAGLAARSSIANSAHADIFISIHANALNDPGFSGLTAFYGASSGYITGVTRTPALVDQSRLLAQDVQHAVLQQTGQTDRGVQSADFYVLGNSVMPAILIETGFITNANEAQRLNTPAFQEQIAEGIATGVMGFFGAVGAPVKQGLDANAGQFVQDVNYPDHTNVTGGQTILKTWKVSNTGTTTWSSGYTLVEQPGGNLSGSASVPLTTNVSPGGATTVSASVNIPSAPGDYSATWRLTAPDGHAFGDPLWLEVTVPGAPFVPFWAETTRAVTVWSDPDPHADAVTQLAQWSYLQITGPAVARRVPVTEPVSQKQGYVDAAAIGPSGAPPAGYQPPALAPPFAPFWVETIKATSLRSGATDPSLAFALLPQWSPLQVIALPSGTRLYVRNPATGGVAFVDASAVGPSGPPTSQPATSPSPAPPAAPGNPVNTDQGSTLQGAPTSAVTYVVKAGDTLFGIALRYHVAMTTLAQANSIANPGALPIGTSLTIPGVTPPFQPFWVENTVAAPLWSGTDRAAKQLGTAAQFTPMQVLAPATGNRYLVRVWTTGGQAYVDAAAVGPVGAPKGAQ